MILEPISQHAEAFSKAAFDTFAPFCLGLMSSLILIAFSLLIFQSLMGKKMEGGFLIKKLSILVLVAGALGAHKTFYWQYIHEPIKLSSDILVVKIVTITPKSTQKIIHNQKEMVDIVENTISEVTTLLFNIADKAGFLMIQAGILSGIIWLLFVATEAIFALYLLGSTLKLAALSALSPFLILAAAFEPTRGHAFSAVKYVLTSVLLLMIAAFCMGLFLFSLREWY